MAMTPRRVFACLRLAAKRQAVDDARRFELIRTAFCADKAQAEKYIAMLTRIIDG